jgi:hypothetical protein
MRSEQLEIAPRPGILGSEKMHAAYRMEIVMKRSSFGDGRWVRKKHE